MQKHTQEQKIAFAMRHKSGEKMSLLCREFGIALRTGFNWCKSYRQIRRNNGKTVCASDFYRLERENAMLMTENEILKSSGLIESASIDLKFQIVERLKEHYSID